MFLVFIPLPYVNAGASLGFARGPRMWVAAAGILAELTLAALALLAWLWLGPGLLRDLSFNVLVVAVGSSLLFNANPLMKFDGYYLFADWLQIPSLASRSNQYLAYLWQRYGLGLAASNSPAALPGEWPWLAGYGLAAGVYRLSVLCFVVGYLARLWLWAGLAVALWAVVGQWLLPAARGLRSCWQKTYGERREWRFVGLVSAFAVVGYVFLFALPLPHNSYAQGVVRLPDYAVYSGAPGFIEAVLAEDGAWVEQGAPLLQLSNSELTLKQAKLSAEINEHESRRQAALVREPAEAQVQAQALALSRARLDDVERQLAALTVYAPRSGRLALPKAQDLPGRWVAEGKVLAHVFDRGDLQAQVLIRQQDLGDVTANAQVWVRSEVSPWQSAQAQLGALTPQARDQLPSRVLGSAAGGRIQIDASNPDGKHALETWFLADLSLPQALLDPVIPNRLHVRFHHPGAPVGIRLWHQIQQWWLDHSAMG